jgi:hypothetical protein
MADTQVACDKAWIRRDVNKFLTGYVFVSKQLAGCTEYVRENLPTVRCGYDLHGRGVSHAIDCVAGELGAEVARGLAPISLRLLSNSAMRLASILFRSIMRGRLPMSDSNATRAFRST